jgi:hypothetical protein
LTDIDTLIDTLIGRLSDRQRREFSLWCAERVRHLMTDSRSTAALDVAARHLRGEATNAELAAARTAALAAAGAAAAWYAAAAAARAAAWYAAGDAARTAAWAAARDEARDEARTAAAAARTAAWDTERAAQRVELERILKEAKNGGGA